MPSRRAFVIVYLRSSAPNLVRSRSPSLSALKPARNIPFPAAPWSLGLQPPAQKRSTGVDSYLTWAVSVVPSGKHPVGVLGRSGLSLSGASLADLKKVTRVGHATSNRLDNSCLRVHPRRSALRPRPRIPGLGPTFVDSTCCDHQHQRSVSVSR